MPSLTHYKVHRDIGISKLFKNQNVSINNCRKMIDESASFPETEFSVTICIISVLHKILPKKITS